MKYIILDSGYIQNLPSHYQRFKTSFGAGNFKLYKYGILFGCVECDYGSLIIIPKSIIDGLFTMKLINECEYFIVQNLGHEMEEKKDTIPFLRDKNTIIFGEYEIIIDDKNPEHQIWINGKRQYVERKLTAYMAFEILFSAE